MVLDEVISNKLQKIDEEAGKNKETILYLADLIVSEYETIKDAFYPSMIRDFERKSEHLKKESSKEGYEGFKKDYLEYKLFSDFSRMMKDMHYDATYKKGITLYPCKIDTPDVILGLTEYFYEESLLLKRITDKGHEWVEGYSKSIGEDKKLNAAARQN